MRRVLLTSAVALLGLAAVPARAMPVSPLSGASTGITQVAWGCGPGWTRGPYGHCHPMRYGYGPGPYGYHPYAYRHCWIGRWGYRHCNW